MQNYFISSEITSGNIQMRNDKIFMIKSGKVSITDILKENLLLHIKSDKNEEK